MILITATFLLSFLSSLGAFVETFLLEHRNSREGFFLPLVEGRNLSSTFCRFVLLDKLRPESQREL